MKEEVSDMCDVHDLLKNKGIKPTPVRVMIYEVMSGYENTFSLTDLENNLLDVDKSTIFRTICVFLEKHLIHSVEDGSGSMKYCVCHNHGECSVELFHCHFYCESCKRTFCLDSLPVPQVQFPEGFLLNQINYVAKGVCPECAKKF